MKSSNAADRTASGAVRTNYNGKPGRKNSGVGKRQAGRPNCLSRDMLGRLLDEYYSHPYSIRELAGMFGVSRMTVWRAVQEPYPAERH